MFDSHFSIFIGFLIMLNYVVDGQQFAIVSGVDGRAVEDQGDGTYLMKDLDTGNANQLWVETDVGNQWFNVGTGNSLVAGSANKPTRSWSLNDKGAVYDTRKTNFVLDRDNAGEDGDSVGVSKAKKNLKDNQKWTIQNV